MLKLFQFKPVFGLPNPSPFCFKVENYLRMAGIAFDAKNGDPRKAPKRKLPFIIDDDGTRVTDSTHILAHLKKTRGDTLDAGLTEQERAFSHVVRRMVEEGLYFNVLYMRWADEPGFAVANAEILQPVLPFLLRKVVPGIVRKSILKQLDAQGTGRHTRDEIYGAGADDLDALSSLLGEKSYFMGDVPRSIDATIYAFAALILGSPPDNPLRDHLRAKTNLVAYCERMKARYYA